MKWLLFAIVVIFSNAGLARQSAVLIAPHSSIWQDNPGSIENLWVECSIINPTTITQNISLEAWPSLSPTISNTGVKGASPLPTILGPYTASLSEGDAFNIRWQSTDGDTIPKLVSVSVTSTGGGGHVMGRCLVWYRQTEAAGARESAGGYNIPFARGYPF